MDKGKGGDFKGGGQDMDKDQNHREFIGINGWFFSERYKRLLKYILKGLRQTEAEKETMEW